MQSALNTRVLKDVSRSFYLSLRFLPKNFRPAASLGYLLARASDTLADAGDWPVADRKALLAGFRERVLHGTSWTPPSKTDGLPPGERILLNHLDDCFSALDELPDAQRKSVGKVVATITEGQTWDLVRFEGPGVVALEADDELREYTYQVAGCVGEFWTEIGFDTDDDFATKSRPEMMALGQAYGRSLQLINILRDVPEDLANGRCYLPGCRTREDLLAARPRWIAEALAGLDSSREYAEALKGKRIRFATFLPALIGRKTLLQLEKATWEDWQNKVKVTRPEVRKMMWQAVRFSLR